MGVVLLPLRANQHVISVVLGLFAGLFALVTMLMFAYYMRVGLFALAGAVHLELSSTIVVALPMFAFYYSLGYFFPEQLGGYENYGRTGSTGQNVLIAGLFVLVVAIQLFSGQVSGTFVTTVVSCLVEHEKYYDGRKGWTPEVDGLNFCYVMAMYYLLSVFTLLLAIHSYSGLSSATYFTRVVALLLVDRYRICGRLVWLEVRTLVVKAAVLFVLWRVLFALLVAMKLYSWRSSEIFFKLVIALFSLGWLLSEDEKPPELAAMIIIKIAILLQSI